MKVRVLLNGTNCVVRVREEPQVLGKVARIGFFTTCCVDASSQAEAGQRAVRRVEERLQQHPVNESGQRWHIEVVEVEDGADEGLVNICAGFARYLDEDDAAK